MNLPPLRALYPRWIAANAFGELFGLGLTLAAGFTLITRLDLPPGPASVLVAFLIAVASGVIEATVVGLAQWWAMRPWTPRITARAWWLGTLVGALLAYVLGYLPSTLIDLGGQTGASAPPAEPPQLVVLLLAAGMGAAAGALLSFAQYFPLRRASARARRWIPANMLAWAAGMPVIFLGIDLAQKTETMLLGLTIMILTLLLAGVIVGAIHGRFLVGILAGSDQVAEDRHS